MNANHNPAEAERKGQACETPDEAAGRHASQPARKKCLGQRQCATEAEEEAEALPVPASGAASQSQWQQRASRTSVKTAELRAVEAARKRQWRQRQRAIETPEEAAERRAAAAVRQKRWRQRKRAGVTPEEAAEFRAAEAARHKRWQQRKLASVTPEEAAERCVARTARKRRWRERKRTGMTPEEAAEWRAAEAARRRRWKEGKLVGVTPEEAAEWRAAQNAKKRRWRERKLAGVGMTPEEAAKWRAAEATRHRRWQQRKLAGVTPEEAAEWRAAQAARKRRWHERKRTGVTPEEAAKYRAAEAARKRLWWQRLRAAEAELVAEARRIRVAKAVRHSQLQQSARATPEVAVAQHTLEAEGTILSCEQHCATLCLANISNQCDIIENRYQLHVLSLLAYKNRVPAQRDEPIPVIGELFCCPGCEDVFSLAESLSHHLKYRTMLVTLPCETCRCTRYFFNKCLAYAHVQQHFPNADVPKLEAIVMRGSVVKYGPMPLSVAEELLQLEETIGNLVKSCCYRQVKEAAANEPCRLLYESGSHDCDNLGIDGFASTGLGR